MSRLLRQVQQAGEPDVWSWRKKNAFSVSYVDGALRAECTPDATPHTLFLMKQSFITMVQTLGRGERLHSTTQVPPPLPPLAEVPIAPLAADPPTTMAETRHAPTATSSPSASGHGIWLSDAIEDWRKNSGVKFSAETWEFAYMATFRVFRELVGDVRRVAPASSSPEGAGQLDILVGSLTRQHILRFYEQLQLLPPRQGKRCDGIEAPLRIAEAGKTRRVRSSRSSIKKKLRHIAPFIVWCELKGYVTAEVLKEFKLAQKAASGSGGVGAKKAIARKPGYIAFAPTELKQIFEQPSYRTGAAKDDWRYWVPLLCLFNGLRVAEASQSHTGDLCIVDGVHCLRTATVKDEDEGEIDDDVTATDETMTEDEYRRRLKNNASRRTVPIHPRLIELGFLDFVASLTTQDGETRHLFPCLPWHPKSLWGRKPSDFMGGLIRKAGVYLLRKKIPHSLRSNFNQAVEKTGLQDALIQRLMGHSTGTMKDESYSEAEYGAAVPAALVHTHLQQTDFDLDLPTWHDLVSWRRSPGTKH